MAESTPRYRNDIDGLRALSVILVILDHLGFTWCSGGFVGVDVFFVISGYVITQTISKDASSGTFSLLAFYERRIRRLLPGLAVVILLAVVAAWCIMLPNDFQALTSSVAAASLAVSNVYFWRQSGYFDALAITKPMLHTWSLGVEEQFYLFYPLLFTWLQKAQKKILLPTLGSLVFISLTLASITTFHHARGTFFLMPPRLWEMLIGGVVFLVFESFKPSKNVGLLFSYGGLLLIGIAAVAYSSNTLFPGLTALLPTSGAILFILAGKADYQSGAYRLMTRPPVLYIGKISYLLYLTHWPLIVLYTYYKISALGWWDKLLIVAASTLLSSGIYAFVERPIRSRAVFRKRWQPYAMATSFIVLCCLLGYIGFATGGFKQRYEGRLTQTTWSCPEKTESWSAEVLLV